MHQRRIIRDAVIAQLAGKTAAGDRVSSTRVEALRNRRLPTISVYALSESIIDVSKTTRPRELTRELAVEIVGWVAHSEANPAADALDDLAEQIEAAVDADPYFGGACGLDGAVLSDTEVTIRDDDKADPLTGIIVLTYSVPYTTSLPELTDLPDLQRIGTTTQIAGAGADNAPQDLFDLADLETP
jgi:hypothetical protein